MRSHSRIRIFTASFWIAKDAKFLHEGNEDYDDCMDAQADLS